MEQEREIRGESVRNRVVEKEDRISELPDALLVEILCQLPTENVMATSALSKRWRSLWKMVPKLKFNSKCLKSEDYRFSEIVVKSLLSHKAPVLESLHLVVRDEYEAESESESKYEASDVGIWIGIAFAHNVRELVVNLGNAVPTRIPSVLWSCNNNLESLKLQNSILLKFPCGVCFKSLRKLYLNYVRFDVEESVTNLFSGCTSLEDLVVHRQSNWDVSTFTIAVPLLQRLTIEDSDPGGEDGGYVIKAPCLKHLSIQGVNVIDFCLIENLPELVEANIVNVCDIKNDNIFVSLTSVKRLSLDLHHSAIKYPSGIIFHQMVSLELSILREWDDENALERWGLLPLMLDTSPNLQILKLTDTYRWNKKVSPVGWGWSQPKCVPECLLFHLETFVWTGYEWQREDEKQVATYILKHARRLKKTTLSTKTIQSKDPDKLEKRRAMMLNELVRLAGPSNLCHLVFN